MCVAGKKNLGEWLSISELWEPSMCDSCRTDEGESDELLDGLPQCEAGRFLCKHLEMNNHRHGLHGNPWHRISAGGLSDVLETFGTVCALSGRDAMSLPTLDAMSYYSDTIPCKEKLFWSMMSRLLIDRRNTTIAKMERNRKDG